MASLLALLTGCANQPSQRIVIDDAHLQLQRADGSAPAVYRIDATMELILDASQYTFSIPPKLNVSRPNSIQLALGKDRQYSATWSPDRTVHDLNKKTLRPSSQSIAFDGIRQSDEGVIAIGHLDPARKNFAVIWVGMFKVE
ncbi:MAG: hypothetical protein C0404_03720 [Verrucomicrobia bacterium]|nr:hypothetical protein [Verrucomicrobiota bacterium]